MPNIGFWATAGAGGGAGIPAYEHIATVYGNSSSSISFSSIPSTYKHLQIRSVAVSTASDSQADWFKIRFNDDSSTTYWSHYTQGYNAGGGLASYGFSLTGGNLAAFTNTIFNSGTTNVSPSIIDIVDYASTTKNKTMKCLSGVIRDDAYDRVVISSGSWPSTAAINKISLIVNSGNGFASTSRFSLYGIKG